MPRGFNEKEFDYYRSRLIDAGSRYFGELGLSGVSVDRLAKETGIAKGSFYKFFKNKEDLCFTCLMVLEKKIRVGIRDEMTGLTADEKIKKLILMIPRIVREYPLLKMFNRKGELEALMMKLPPQDMEDNFQGDMLFFQELFPGCEKAGIKPETMTAFFWSLLHIAFNKDFVGEPFEDVMVLLAEMTSLFFKERL